MSAKRIVGLILVVVGIVALAMGGVFWTDRDKIVDAGPLQVSTSHREGVALPPVVGGLALIGGIVLLFLPDRRRV